MTTQDLSSLIDWNSPVVEFHCKPLIPLPQFDGQPVIDGDNPFDDLEKQLDQNEPFDMVLNQSLNSSSDEQLSLDKITETIYDQSPCKSNEINSPTRVAGIFDGLNLHSNESAPNDISNMIDISPIDIESSTSEVQVLRKRLGAILDKYTTPEGVNHQNRDDHLIQASFDGSLCNINKSTSTQPISLCEDTNSSASINKAFIRNDNTFDPFSTNFNDVYEDLSLVIPPTWVSSGSEEDENSPTKIVPVKNSTSSKNKTSTEKVVKKTCPRLPLSSKDPNIRARRKLPLVKEVGPLKAVMPVENMAKNVNQKLVETPKHKRFSRKIKIDVASLKPKRKSMPIATSTPVVTPSLSAINKSKVESQNKSPTPSAQPSRSHGPSPDSTTSRFVPKSANPKTKVCSRRLALNAVSSSTSLGSLPTYKKSSKDVKYSSLNSSVKSTATGVKSCVKNKENLVPFRF